MSLISTDKYPFLKSFEEAIKDYGGIKFYDIIATNGQVLNDAKERIKKILEDSNVESFKKYRNSSLVFYTEMLILAIMNDRRIIEKVLKKEAENFSKEISEESEDQFKELLKRLKVPIEYKKIVYHNGNRKIELTYAINFVSYLTLIRSLSNSSLSLSQNILNKGYVYLDKKNVLGILKNIIYNRLYQSIKPISLSEIPETLKDLIIVKKGKTPPCIEGLIRKKDKNFEEIKILIVYKMNTNNDLNSIINFLKENGIQDAENSVKEIFRKREKYILYSCRQMKEKNLCVAECGVKNPLQLYFGTPDDTKKNL
jgi:DNA primase large subunit